jgi:hypothetical protein
MLQCIKQLYMIRIPIVKAFLIGFYQIYFYE